MVPWERQETRYPSMAWFCPRARESENTGASNPRGSHVLGAVFGLGNAVSQVATQHLARALLDADGSLSTCVDLGWRNLKSKLVEVVAATLRQNAWRHLEWVTDAELQAWAAAGNEIHAEGKAPDPAEDAPKNDDEDMPQKKADRGGDCARCRAD